MANREEVRDKRIGRQIVSRERVAMRHDRAVTEKSVREREERNQAAEAGQAK